jgi:hypothetical protein
VRRKSSAVQLDQVESNQHRVSAVALVTDEVEYRQSTLIGDNRLAVDQERATR